MVNNGVGPALATKGLTAGAGISLTGAATLITVANTDPGSAVTLASAGGMISLVNDGVGPALAVRGLTAGTGITITSDTVSATVSASGSATTVLARADATSYAVSSSATCNFWALATGQGGNGASSQAYIPSISRIVAGGKGLGTGAIYSDDGDATWIAATTVIASSGAVGYSPTLGVVTWRAGTEVRTSTDSGVNYTLQAPFATSSGIPTEGHFSGRASLDSLWPVMEPRLQLAPME